MRLAKRASSSRSKGRIDSISDRNCWRIRTRLEAEGGLRHDIGSEMSRSTPSAFHSRDRSSHPAANPSGSCARTSSRASSSSCLIILPSTARLSFGAGTRGRTRPVTYLIRSRTVTRRDDPDKSPVTLAGDPESGQPPQNRQQPGRGRLPPQYAYVNVRFDCFPRCLSRKIVSTERVRRP